MIVEIGHFCLISALYLCLLQAVLLPYLMPTHFLIRLLSAITPLTSSLMAISFFSLVYAYIVSDFSVVSVALNSHSATPLLYKVTGLWGSHEGSLLLWTFYLSLVGYGLYQQKLPEGIYFKALTVHSWVLLLFLSFLVFASDPFKRLLFMPLEGMDLNPTLQDKALALHPPILFIGYVGLSASFSIAMACLWHKSFPKVCLGYIRQWNVVAWVSLTLGISLGSLWAYYELGWGGWWFWDPVENASFIPWLLATALLHSLKVSERFELAKRWNVLLLIFAFGSSLVGTFIVRSGLISSIHAFAMDALKGSYILVILLGTMGSSFWLYHRRITFLPSIPFAQYQSRPRVVSLLLNNILFVAAAFIVLVGTLYPLFPQLMGFQGVTVGEAFFNAFMVPILLLAAVLMGISPFLAWQGQAWSTVCRKLLTLLLFIALSCLFFFHQGASQGPHLSFLVPLCVAIGSWLLLYVLFEWWQRLKGSSPRIGFYKALLRVPLKSHGMTLAHLGFALTLFGIVGDKFFQSEVTAALKIGDEMALHELKAKLIKVDKHNGPNYISLKAILEIRKRGELVTTLAPEKRIFLTQHLETSETSLHTSWLTNLYAVAGTFYPSGAAAIQLSSHPFVVWIWIGTVLMAFGGLCVFASRFRGLR